MGTLNQLMGGFCGRMGVALPPSPSVTLFRGAGPSGIVEIAEVRESPRQAEGTFYLSAGGDFYRLLTKSRSVGEIEGRKESGAIVTELPGVGDVTLVLEKFRLRRLNLPAPLADLTEPLAEVVGGEREQIVVERQFRGLPNTLKVKKLFQLDDPGGAYEGYYALVARTVYLEENYLFFFGQAGAMREAAFLTYEEEGMNGSAYFWKTSVGTLILLGYDGGMSWSFGPPVEEGRAPRVAPMRVVESPSSDLLENLGVRLQETDPIHSRVGNRLKTAWRYPVLGADRVEERIGTIWRESGSGLEVVLDPVDGLVILSGGNPIYVRDLVGIAVSGGDILFATYDNPDDREPALYRVAAGAFPVAVPRDRLAPGLLRELNL